MFRGLVALLLGAVAGLVIVSTARADEGAPIPEQTATTCAAAFKKRLKATQAAITAAAAFDGESRRVMPWAEAHCRPMTDLERAVRKENDDKAIVCDSAKGRPVGLTGKFFWEHSNALQVESWDPYTAYDYACSSFDPISLDMRDLIFDRGELQARAAAAVGVELSDDVKLRILAEQERALAGQAHAIAVKCFGADSAKCSAGFAKSAKPGSK